jgi:Domain of unknown function (DUF1707)
VVSGGNAFPGGTGFPGGAGFSGGAREMRVSDGEREAAAAELREHFASGRLTQDELEERLTAVFAAKTRGDLSGLFTDLPSSANAGGGRASGPGASDGGPFSGGPFAAGPFGPRGDWRRLAQPGAGGGYDWQAQGASFRASAGRMLARIVLTTALIWALFIFGILGVFGIGTGRPLGAVLLAAAFLLLRRLVFIFGGRRRGRGPRRGPRRRR